MAKVLSAHTGGRSTPQRVDPLRHADLIRAPRPSWAPLSNLTQRPDPGILRFNRGDQSPVAHRSAECRLRGKCPSNHGAQPLQGNWIQSKAGVQTPEVPDSIRGLNPSAHKDVISACPLKHAYSIRLPSPAHADTASAPAE